MKASDSHYPTVRAFFALLNFSNACLPYPRKGIDHMTNALDPLVNEFLGEVRRNARQLNKAELTDYAKWLDKQIGCFYCIYWEGRYDPLSNTHTIVSYCPPEKNRWLQDEHPEFRNLKHKLSHQAIIVLNRMVKYLDQEVWEIHPILKNVYSGVDEDYLRNPNYEL